MTPTDIGFTRRTVGFAGLAVASFLGCIDLTIVSTALPVITRDLHTTLAASQLVMGGFLTALAMFMITAGRLGDTLGRKPVLLTGLGVFVLASVGAAAAPAIGWLIAARFVQGLACAVLYTGTSTLVESLFPDGQRGRAIGLLYAINGVGLAIGPVLGGLLVPALGWQSVFWLNLPVGGLALLAIAYAVPSPAANSGVGLDLGGQAALAVTVAAAVAFVSLPETTGWLSVPVLVAAVLTIVGAAVAVLVERRAAAPLLRPDLFRHPKFVSALSSDFFLAAFYASALVALPPYLGAEHRLDARATGLILLLVSVTMAALSPRVGKVVDRTGPAGPLRLGFAAFVLSAVATVIAAIGGSLLVLSIALILFGAGWAGILAPATVAALSSVDRDESGFAVGASWTFHNLGGALGAAIAAGLYAASGNPGGGLLRVAVLLLIVAVFGLTANVLTARVRRDDQQSADRTPTATSPSP